MSKSIVHHIPVCPFSQRLEILLQLKNQSSAVEFRLVDITQPRDPELLRKTRGVTALPVLETETGVVLRESLVLLRYLDESFGPRIASSDPLSHAIENLFITHERELVNAGYTLVLNQDRSRREQLYGHVLKQYAALNAFLTQYAPKTEFLLEHFGYAEAVFTPIFVRFHFLEYYEGFELPNDEQFARVRAYCDACLKHPAAQQITREQVVKCYYDYAKGAGNGALLPGRTRSSFALEPRWETRPWPPRGKYDVSATDTELGLL